jgi:hypothetical protein
MLRENRVTPAATGRSICNLSRSNDSTMAMGKKEKKQAEAIRNRLKKLRQQLAGAKQQCDDPAEAARLQQQVNEAEAELQKLKDA